MQLGSRVSPHLLEVTMSLSLATSVCFLDCWWPSVGDDEFKVLPQDILMDVLWMPLPARWRLLLPAKLTASVGPGPETSQKQ